MDLCPVCVIGTEQWLCVLIFAPLDCAVIQQSIRAARGGVRKGATHCNCLLAVRANAPTTQVSYARRPRDRLAWSVFCCATQVVTSWPPRVSRCGCLRYCNCSARVQHTRASVPCVRALTVGPSLHSRSAHPACGTVRKSISKSVFFQQSSIAYCVQQSNCVWVCVRLSARMLV